MNYVPFGGVAASAGGGHFQSVISALGTALHDRQMFITSPETVASWIPHPQRTSQRFSCLAKLTP